MPHLTLGVLGPLHILVGDRPVTSLESEKARALLAFLAVEAGRAHRRDALVGLLWPDSSETLARGNLRQALYTLRQAIADQVVSPPHLSIQREEIQFNTASDYTLDMAAFESRLAACAAHPHSNIERCSECAQRLQTAAALYRGRFLDQFFLKDSAAFEEWALVHRESLHRRALEALAHLANYHLQQSEYEQAVSYAQRQLELDPWREEAHGQMMRALAATGQRSAALEQYETCQKLLAEELGVEPTAETKDLYSQIGRGEMKVRRAEERPASVSTIRPLPLPLTPFVGRERELAQVAALLADDQCSLITIVGPGGMGKTRLALQAASQHGAEFADGTAFVPLASVATVTAIFPALAEALGLTFSGPGGPERQVITFLRDKHLLLVVDNVEHLLEAASLWVRLLQSAPKVKLLLTSREALNVQDEWVFELEGLPVPESEAVADPEAYAAVALFLQRARRTRVGFELSPEERPAVLHLCRLVAGIPLALELAATWVRTLSCGEIVHELETNLDFLTVSVRDLEERHRSVRAVFDQSWKMLTSPEQQALAKLSVFRGGFSREAAEAVAGAPLSLLSALVAKSLVRRTNTGRYGLHELVRQYAAAQLSADLEAGGQARQRHSVYCLDMLQRRHEVLQSNRQKDVLAELTTEMDNLRGAWAWAVAHGDVARVVQVSPTLWYLIELKNWFLEGETIFRQAAESFESRSSIGERSGEAPLEAVNAMLAHSAFFAVRRGKNEAGYATLSAVADPLHSSADTRAAIYALSYLGLSCWQLGRFGEAQEHLREGVAKARAAGERWYECMDTEFLGIVAHELGEFEQAESYLQQALIPTRQLGDTFLIAHVQTYLCRTLLALGKYSQAGQSAQESLQRAKEIGYRAGEGMALDALGQVASAQARHDEARRLFAAGILLLQEIGATLPLTRVLCHQGVNSLALRDIPHAEEAFATALRIACQDGLAASALTALAGMANVYAHKGAGEQGLELVLQVLEHPGSTQEAKNLVTPLRARLESQMTSEQIQDACERARSKTYNELAQRVLADD